MVGRVRREDAAARERVRGGRWRKVRGARDEDAAARSIARQLVTGGRSRGGSRKSKRRLPPYARRIPDAI